MNCPGSGRNFLPGLAFLGFIPPKHPLQSQDAGLQVCLLGGGGKWDHGLGLSWKSLDLGIFIFVLEV